MLIQLQRIIRVTLLRQCLTILPFLLIPPHLVVLLSHQRPRLYFARCKEPVDDAAEAVNSTGNVEDCLPGDSGITSMVYDVTSQHGTHNARNSGHLDYIKIIGELRLNLFRMPMELLWSTPQG